VLVGLSTELVMTVSLLCESSKGSDVCEVGLVAPGVLFSLIIDGAPLGASVDSSLLTSIVMSGFSWLREAMV